MIATVAALAWTVRVLIGRLGTLGDDLDRLQREVTPALRQLEAGTQVTSTEMHAVGDRVEARAAATAGRRRRRWRPVHDGHDR